MYINITAKLFSGNGVRASGVKFNGGSWHKWKEMHHFEIENRLIEYSINH